MSDASWRRAYHECWKPRNWTSHSPLREEFRNVLRRNRPFAQDLPARLFVGEIDDGGSNFSWRGTSVHDDGNANSQLVADRFGSGAFRFAAQVCGGGSDWNARSFHDLQGNFRIRNAQGHVAGVGGHL